MIKVKWIIACSGMKIYIAIHRESEKLKFQYIEIIGAEYTKLNITHSCIPCYHAVGDQGLYFLSGTYV